MGAILKLEQGTPEQQRMFAEACADVPLHIQTALKHRGITFHVDNSQSQPGQRAKINPTEFIIPEYGFKSDAYRRRLPQIISGYGLAMVLKPTIENSVLKDAWHEHVDRTYLDSGLTGSSVQLDIEREKNRNVYNVDIKGRILAGISIDLLDSSRTRFSHLLEKRKKIYDAYKKALEDRPLHYACADTLSDPEKCFFTALEKVRELTHESRGNFEYNIRSRLHMILFNTPIAVAPHLVARTNADYGRNETVHVTHQRVQGSRLSEILDAMRISIEATGPQPPGGIAGQEFNPSSMSAALISRMKRHFDRLTHLRLSPFSRMYNEEIAQGIETCNQHMGGRVHYELYNSEKLLFEPYLTGERHLHELSNEPMTHDWLNYRITVPSEREYLITAIEEAARLTASYKNLGPEEDRELRKGLSELRAAFNEAVLTPREREAKEAMQRDAQAQALAAAERLKREREAATLRSRGEDLRKSEEALLTPTPYGLNSRLESLKARATRQGPPPPEKELGDAWKQIEPLTTLLNRNLAPHLQTGNALFSDHGGRVLGMLDYIATEKDMATHVNHPDFALRQAQVRESLIRLLADPLEVTAQPLQTPGMRERLIEASQERHTHVIKALTEAPLLLIAALGSPDMIIKGRMLQRELFPPPKGGKKSKPLDEGDDTDRELAKVARDDIRYLAGKAVRYAFKEAGRSHMPASLAAALPQGPPAPPRPPVDRGHTPDWDEVRRRVTDFLVETLQSGVNEGRPFTLFRCRVDHGEPGDTTPHLHVVLARWIPEPGGARLRNDFRELDIGLGNTPLATALQWRRDIHDMVMSQRPFLPDRKLQIPAIHNFLELVLPNVLPVLHRTEQKDGVWQLHLRFEEPSQTAGIAPHITETYIPLGVPQRAARPDDREQMVLTHLAEMRTPTEGGERIITAPDVRAWIENHIQAAHQPWEGPETVRLDRPAAVDVDFHNTRIEINRFTVKGTPTGDQKIPVTFYRMVPNGRGQAKRQEIYTCEVNSHRSTEQGARDCIPQILSHMKQYLEAYGQQHPDARWFHTQDGGLGQYEAGRDGEHVDITKLRWMLSGLEYPCQFKVHAVDTTRYEGDKAVGKPTFRMEVLQPDDALFQERSPLNREALPLQREFRINEEKLTRDEVQRRITECRQETQRLFSEQLCHRFSPRQDGNVVSPANGDSEAAPIHFPPTDTGWQTVHPYQPSTVRKLFAAAYRDYNRTHGIEELPRSTAQGAGGINGVQPSDPMHHHVPASEQLEAERGFRGRYGRRRDGFTPSL